MSIGHGRIPGAVGPDAFIRANTRLMAPPLVPEILLHLAEESLPIWRNTEEELGEMNVPPPYWAFAWAGGQALARYVLDNPVLVAGRDALDLGCGSGVSGLAAARAGAHRVVAADIDAFARAAVAMNAAANGLSVETTAANVLAAPADIDWAVVLVGDLFYERELAALVEAFIDRAQAGGALVLVGDPQRSYFPKGRFTAVAEYSVPVTRELEDVEIKRTSVWRLDRA